MRLFSSDDVLVGVVEIVMADHAGRGFVSLQQRQPFSSDLGQKLLQFVLLHAYDCFSLQLMQDRVHGIAVRRASAIGSPQSRQTPYEPSSMRRSAPSMACRILASVCFSFSWMWTSLLPAAWSAMSPWRPELFSIVHCNGLVALPPSSSKRFLISASRKISTFIAWSPPGRPVLPEPSGNCTPRSSARKIAPGYSARSRGGATLLLCPQRGERLVA